jgi:hypothetical protein
MASGVDARLLKSTKFPPEFNTKVDMQKVNLQVMKKLVAVPAALEPRHADLSTHSDGLQAKSLKS